MMMSDCVLGLLRVRVVRGVNLAIRDFSFRASDPYVVLHLGQKELRTSIVKRSLNPEWNEDLTFSVLDLSNPLKIQVMDKDTFTPDDMMGDAEFDIRPFVEGVHLQADSNGNKASHVHWSDGKVTQDLIIKLRNVECGEIHLQLQWTSLHI